MAVEIRNPPLTWCLWLVAVLFFSGGAWLVTRSFFVTPASLAEQRLRIIGNSLSYAGSFDITDIHNVQVILPDNISEKMSRDILIDPSSNSEFKLTRDYYVNGALSESIIFAGPFGSSGETDGYEYIILTKDYNVVMASAALPHRKMKGEEDGGLPIPE